MKFNISTNRIKIIFIIISLVFVFSERASLKTSTNMHFGLFSAKQKTNFNKIAETNNRPNEQFQNLTKDDLPDVPIYFEGWIKYFHYRKNEEYKKKQFFKNLLFNTQVKSNSTKPDDEVTFLI